MRRSLQIPGLFHLTIFPFLIGVGGMAFASDTQGPDDSKPAGSATNSPPVGFAPSSRAGQSRAEAPRHRGAGTGRGAEAAADLDRRAACGGYEGGLQDRRFCAGQAPRMGLESGDRRARGSAQLSWLRSYSQHRTPDHEIPLARRSADRDRQGFGQQSSFGAFNGYGVSGKAYGQVVYANYGSPEDFEAVEKLGIDVKGKIVLVRYGNLFRGLKVRNAQKRAPAES